MIRRREANDFQSRTGADGNAHRQDARAHSDFTGAMLNERAVRDWRAARHLRKDFW
jgi:hypothetical protein